MPIINDRMLDRTFQAKMTAIKKMSIPQLEKLYEITWGVDWGMIDTEMRLAKTPYWTMSRYEAWPFKEYNALRSKAPALSSRNPITDPANPILDLIMLDNLIFTDAIALGLEKADEQVNDWEHTKTEEEKQLARLEYENATWSTKNFLSGGGIEFEYDPKTHEVTGWKETGWWTLHPANETIKHELEQYTYPSQEKKDMLKILQQQPELFKATQHGAVEDLWYEFD